MPCCDNLKMLTIGEFRCRSMKALQSKGDLYSRRNIICRPIRTTSKCTVSCKQSMSWGWSCWWNTLCKVSIVEHRGPCLIFSCSWIFIEPDSGRQLTEDMSFRDGISPDTSDSEFDRTVQQFSSRTSDFSMFKPHFVSKNVRNCSHSQPAVSLWNIMRETCFPCFAINRISFCRKGWQ